MAKGNSPLKILGITCGVLVLVGGIAMVVLAYLGYNMFRQLDEDMKNPEQKAQQVLPHDSLPEGYHLQAAFSVPYVASVFMLSDKPRIEHEGPKMGDKGFLYTHAKIVKVKRPEELESFFSGQSDDMRVLRDNKIDVDFDPEDILSRGVFDLEDVRVRFLTVKDGIDAEDFSSKGLTALIQFDCPDQQVRFSLWYTEALPMPLEGGGYDFTGTVGDEAELRKFLGHFHFCTNTRNQDSQNEKNQDAQ